MSSNQFIDCSPIVRTDFSDDVRWAQLMKKAGAENNDGFFANLEAVEDRAFEGALPDTIVKALAERMPAVVFVADPQTFSESEPTLLCVHRKNALPPFRCILPELWGVENNLRIANMGFEEFASATGSDGVFRGF